DTSRIEELLRRKPHDEPVFEGHLALERVETGPVRSTIRRRPTPRMVGVASAAIVTIAIAIAGFVVIDRQRAADSPTPTQSSPTTAPVIGVVPWVAATVPPAPTPEPTPAPATLAR